MKPGVHGKLIIETLGEHFTVADTFKLIAQIQESDPSMPGSWAQNREIEKAIRMKAELGAISLGVEEPTYDNTEPYVTNLDQFLAQETLAALRISSLVDPGSDLANAADLALHDFDLSTANDQPGSE